MQPRPPYPPSFMVIEVIGERGGRDGAAGAVYMGHAEERAISE